MMNPHLQTTMANIEARRSLIRSSHACQVGQLPLWSDSKRGFPNAFARSALFTVGGNKTRRKVFEKQPIATVRGFDIYYTGIELRQDDEDVFLQLVHQARQMPLGEYVEFSAHGLLTEINWNRSKKSYDRLKRCIDRLSANTVTVVFPDGQAGYGGSLFRKFMWDHHEANGRWRVWLEPEIVNLFTDQTYTQLDWEERLTLPPLAKWLHSFYFSHREPFGYRVQTLKLLCASDAKQLVHFRSTLRRNLDLLVGCGFFASWAIQNDVLNVVRRRRQPALPAIAQLSAT